ncbi:AKT2 [Symbiodinium necroappetens]|uniref:AKT2 protein n=1 Tax=Symbiodinium necroappetens TaxID=1628268 RepID=A0A812PLX4_9DINO|nr:AKT2 [Symbiodinium necroappetens]
MGPLRFQLNILQYILDFSSLQQDAINEAEERTQIEEDEKKKVKTLQGREPQADEPVETVVMSDGQTITNDRKYMKSMAEINSNTDGSSENVESEDASDQALSNVSSGGGAASPASYRGANTRVARHRSEHADGIPKASRFEFFKGILASFGILRGGDDGNGRVKQRVARKFRELDEDGEGISLADVATLLTDVLGRKLDRDAMLRLAANVFDNAEKSEQDLLQLGDVLGSLEAVTADFNALVKRREQHSSGQTANDGEMSWACVQRLSGLVLPPDSIWLRIWDTLRRVVIIYFMLEVPMRFAISNVDMLPEPSRTIFLTINVSFDCFMFLNLLLTFMRGYVQSSGVTVMDFHQIRVRYLLGNFSWDVLACFPIDLLVAGFYDSREYATWRLFKLLHLRHLFGKGQGRVSESGGGFLFTCFKIMLQLYVLLHFMACTLWYLGNGISSGYDGPGWFRIYEGMSHRLGVVNQPHVPVLEQYVLSLYGMMLLLTNDSTDLLNPSSYYELGWLIVCFIVSVALNGHIDGALVGKVISQDESIVESRVMRSRVDTFISNSGLPPELAEQIRLNTSTTEASGSVPKGDRTADQRTMEAVLTSLSRGLLTRIGRRVFLKWLQGVGVFKGCSEPFLLQLATTSRLWTFSAGAFVSRVGEPATFLVILRSGAVQIRDANNDEVDRVEEKGTAFCDISCMFGLRHKMAIICEEETQLIKLRAEDLHFAMQLHPKDQETINGNVVKVIPEAQTMHRDPANEGVGAAMGMPMTMLQDDDHSAAHSVSTKRRRRVAGGVDLFADLAIHDLNLEGVAEVRSMIRTQQEKKAQQRVNDFIEFAAQGKWEMMETMLKANKVTVDSGRLGGTVCKVGPHASLMSAGLGLLV